MISTICKSVYQHDRNNAEMTTISRAYMTEQDPLSTFKFILRPPHRQRITSSGTTHNGSDRGAEVGYGNKPKAKLSRSTSLSRGRGADG